MKLSDYIIEYFYNVGITDYFGYQGTMIAHFVDSIGKDDRVNNHVCYNEQGAALAAVGYAKVSDKRVCAYSTSGPGATNLITGIADAYYDSVPVIFISGQLNTYEYSNIRTLRQQGFQETNIVDMVKPITKYAVQINKPSEIAYELEKAIYIANNGRPGPVLLDIPMDIQRSEIEVEKLKHFNEKQYDNIDYSFIAKNIIKNIQDSKRPILVLGNGIRKNGKEYENVKKLISLIKIPILYSMLAKSLISDDNRYNFGFMGTAYGQRYSNIIGCKKADLIVSLGCRMNGRTIGLKRKEFNPKAKIIRVDVDDNELNFKIHDDDLNYKCDVNELIENMNQILENSFKIKEKKEWLNVCDIIKEKLKDVDKNIPEYLPNKYVEILNCFTDETTNVFADVGQNQIWAAHSIKVKDNQKLVFSGGLGAMGFALPASIGGCIANNKKKTFVIVGDGGLQMNIQELQTLKVEKLPITIFVFNNDSLGLIHQQQCDFFDNKFFGACKEGGYNAPNFKAIAQAYGIESYEVDDVMQLNNILKTYNSAKPTLIEIKLPVGTKAYPKTNFGHEMINQRPELDKNMLNELLNL